MEIAPGLGSCLAVTQPRALFAVAAQKLALEPRPLPRDQFVSLQCAIGCSQDNVALFGRVLPVHEHPPTPWLPARDGPDHGRRERHMVGCRQGPQGHQPVQILPVDLAVILAPRPAARGVRAGVEEPTVGSTTSLGHRVTLAAHNCREVFVLRKGAVHAVRGPLWRSTLTRRAQLWERAIQAGVFLRLWGTALAGGGWATARVQAPRRVPSTPARVDISSPRAGREVQPWKKGPRPHVG
jgi:hypothetical protein